MGIVEFENVRFTYDGETYALDGIDLSVERGEFVCVLGGNGSGKSTLAKHVNALIVPDEGTVRVLDRNTHDADATYFIRSNAGMVFQNPDDQIVASIIEDDVAFGPENLGIPNPALRDRVTRALEQVGLQGFETRETSALSGGQKQRVAIAGVLAMEPQVLVLDEASAMLDPRGRTGLLRVCRELNAAGLTIIYITHFMEEAVEAHRVVVLDAGRVTLSGTPREVLTQVGRLKELHLDIPFAARMSSALRAHDVPVALHVREDDLEHELRDLIQPDRKGHADGALHASGQSARDGAMNPKEATSSNRENTASACGEEAASTGGLPIVQMENVSFTYEPSPNKKRRKSNSTAEAKPAKWGNDPDERWALRHVSLKVNRGEFVGLAGHTGSGKSTLIQLAAGLLKPNEGRVLLAGVNLADKREARSARSSVGLVFQYPERQLFAATVFDDVSFGPRNLGLSAGETELRVRTALAMMHLNLDELRDRSPFALSGGQQRRVAIAGVLAMEPQVLVMDEPTAGLDPQSREALLNLIAELHDERHLTVMLVSHSMDDLARLCNRIVVLNRGELVAEGVPTDVFADENALKGIGLGIPHALHLANALGIDAGTTVPTVSALAGEIAKRVRP